MNRLIYILLAATLAFVSCHDDRILQDPEYQLEFSADTVRFDTVFTTIGSVTARLMVRNPYSGSLRISRIWQRDGRFFHINVDGENDTTRLHDFVIRGGDSMFVFINTMIDRQGVSLPLLLQDEICFEVNEKVQRVVLEAYGQDATIIRSKNGLTEYDDCCFTADLPYLIFDTIVVNGKLELKPGCRLYFHQGTSLLAKGDVVAEGTLHEPILLRGDRLDNLFDSVPYLYAAGQWGGLFLLPNKTDSITYTFDYVDILSGNVGLYCTTTNTNTITNTNTPTTPHLTLHNSRIHNHAIYGLVLLNTDAEVVNCEISNCASYCVYLEGGTHRFVHTTVSSYFNSTNIRIQSASREDVAAVYIHNLDKSAARTNSSFLNCIIAGIRQNNMVLATPLPQSYEGQFVGNWLKADSLSVAVAHDNIYWQSGDTLPMFVNSYYKYKEYVYYNFQLDSLSPARGIGDSLVASKYPVDRLGHARQANHADAGCYQWVDTK